MIPPPHRLRAIGLELVVTLCNVMLQLRAYSSTEALLPVLPRIAVSIFLRV